MAHLSSQLWGIRDRRISGFADLAELVNSRFSERPCLKRVTREDTLPHICVCARTQTETHTHT